MHEIPYQQEPGGMVEVQNLPPIKLLLYSLFWYIVDLCVEYYCSKCNVPVTFAIICNYFLCIV